MTDTIFQAEIEAQEHAQRFFDQQDEVNHPKRYTKGEVECIEAIEAAVIGKTSEEAILVAPVIKYLWRYEDKGGVEDLLKARWYLDRLITLMEKRIKFD